MFIRILTTVAVLAAASGVAFADDLAAGATSDEKGMACHDVGAAAKNKVGPVLNGLDGRKSGSIPSRSPPPRRATSSRTTWRASGG